MKFPYELSEQRLSLLSPEDQATYIAEHSEFYSVAKREEAYREYNKAKLLREGYYLDTINEDSEFDELNEEEKVKMSKILANIEMFEAFDSFADIMRDLINEGALSDEMWAEVKRECFENFNNNADSINESGGTPGWDMTKWAEGAGIASLSIMGLVFSGLIGLFMAGKTRMAIRQLKKYMARIVEIKDDGYDKPKSWLSGVFSKVKNAFGGKGSKYKAENQSTECLRKIQCDFQKQMACAGMILLKNMGFLTGDCNRAIDAIEQNDYSEGGLSIFQQRIADQINILANE